MESKHNWVSVHDAAKILKCTHAAIYQCTMRAKYKGHVKYINGILHVDLPYFKAKRKGHRPEGDERVAANRARERRHTDAKMKRHREEPEEKLEDKPRAYEQPSDFSDPIDQRRAWAAKMDELKYRRMVNEVILAKVVRAEAFEAARLCRDSMLAIPDRVSGLVAAENDERKCFDILYEEIHRVLSDLSDQVSKLKYMDEYGSEE